MKKVILALVVIATALCGCSKDIPTGPHTGHVGEYPILFGYSDTRAVADLDILKDNGFKVYAYFTGYADDPQGRYGTFEKYVEHTTQNVWAYEGLEYWIPGVSYWFTAFYPHDLSGLQIQNNTKDQSYTISGFDITKQEDVMVAEATASVPNGATCPTGGNVVNLNFKHLLACVTIAVKSEIKDITINSITLNDINDNGNYDGEWSSSNSCSITIDSATSLVTGDDKYTDVSNGGFLVIPAEISGVTLTINASNKTYENIEIPAITWQKGMKYTYRVDIKQNDIVFNDPNVAKWDSDSATGSVIIK